MEIQMLLLSYSIFLLLSVLVNTQRHGSVPLNSSLTSSEAQQFSSSWLSPSGDFAFGFRKIEPNNDFLVAIWFDKIPDKTIVWYAYIDVSVPTGSKLTLTGDRGLVLTNPQGKQIWRSEISATGSVSRGFMKDSGNFVLEDQNFDELWSTFANPTDTLLPTQVLELGGVLSSRQSKKIFSKGRFKLRMLENGNLELNAINVPTGNVYDAYFRTETNNSGFRLVFGKSGDMYISGRNNTVFNLYEGDGISSENVYRRAILHFDGVFAQYYYNKQQNTSSSPTWLQVWSKPDDICRDLMNDIGSGACGFNSACRLEGNGRPNCTCPQGFSLVDESNEYGDCKLNYELSLCGYKDGDNRTMNDTFGFIRLQDIDWPLSDYEQYQPYDEERCQNSCLQDCFCNVAIFRNASCWKKRYPLSNGRVDRSLNVQVFVKVPKGGNSTADECYPERKCKDKGKNRNVLIITGATILGTSVFVNLIFITFSSGIFISLCRKKRSTRNAVVSKAVESNLRAFMYEELVEATSEFEEELGRGAYGIVYKGVIKGGMAGDETVVAIKKLDRVVQEIEKEFKNEVTAIGQTHHKNLVKLIGYCNEGRNRLLVYEFIPNGTLADFLFRHPHPSWEQRKKIAVGIARGIAYLHEECSVQIIHCDIKPQNVLLDENYNARISDFGLAKLLRMNQTHTHTVIRGTKGYVALEWFKNNPITSKVDVFSYGVLLLEIICCKKAVDLENEVILTDRAYDCFQQESLIDLIGGDFEAMEDTETVERYVKIAIWCIQEEPGKRPNMRRVTQMLEGVVEVGVPPNPSP